MTVTLIIFSVKFQENKYFDPLKLMGNNGFVTRCFPAFVMESETNKCQSCVSDLKLFAVTWKFWEQHL